MNKFLSILAVVAIMSFAQACNNNKKAETAPVKAETTTSAAPVTDANGKLTVIDFFATWCGPCKMFAPVFEQASKGSYAEKYNFESIDVDKNSEMAQKYQVQSIPTILIVDANGGEIARFNGYMDMNQFNVFLKNNLK